MTVYKFAATMPVQMDGPNSPPTDVPITLLAADIESAIKQAADAGFTLVGPLDINNQLIKP